jgi:hypothetical protein
MRNCAIAATAPLRARAMGLLKSRMAVFFMAGNDIAEAGNHFCPELLMAG